MLNIERHVRTAHSGAFRCDFSECRCAWFFVYSRFHKRIEDGILDNVFRTFGLDTALQKQKTFFQFSDLELCYFGIFKADN